LAALSPILVHRILGDSEHSVQPHTAWPRFCRFSCTECFWVIGVIYYSLDAGKDWLVVTPAGFFDGSPGACRLVSYRVPGTLKLVDDDATRRRFHRPGLLAQVWKGEK
jgi:hypothetical protein